MWLWSPSPSPPPLFRFLSNFVFSSFPSSFFVVITHAYFHHSRTVIYAHRWSVSYALQSHYYLYEFFLFSISGWNCWWLSAVTHQHAHIHTPACPQCYLAAVANAERALPTTVDQVHPFEQIICFIIYISCSYARSPWCVCVCVRFPLIFLFVCLLLPHDKRSRSSFNLLYLKITKNEWKKEQISRTIAKQIPFNWRRATSDERERERKKKENRVIVRISYLALVDM